MQLTMTDINGIDLLRIRLQQAIGKTACAGAKIRTYRASGIYGEDVQRMGQFFAAPADKPRSLPERNLLPVRYRFAGGQDWQPIDQHISGHDQCPRPGPRFGQISDDDRLIQSHPRFGRRSHLPATRSAKAWL